jgi:pyrroloquinoline quinone (PQQ) biosynthesis protein C
MSYKLGLSSRPMLAPNTTISLQAEGAVVETESATYTFEGDSARIIAAVGERLDGRARLSELASEVGVSAEHLRATLDALAGDEVVIDTGVALEAISPDVFLPQYHRLCSTWAKEIYATPFWQKMESGEASRTLVLGWGVEFYHYVDGANEHMAASTCHCREDYELRRWLAHHYVDEHDHGPIFLKGLERCGLDPWQIRQAPPLASTRALINFLYELACSDSIAYAATFGIMHHEPEGMRQEQVSRYFDDMTARYGFATGLFDSIKEHAKLDEGLDHETLVLERLLRRNGTVSPDAALRILRAARSAAEHFVLFFEGIADFYGAPEATVPRRPADARWLLR